MIVKSINRGWRVVMQPAHGLLAGKIGSFLKPEHHSVFWFETLAMITAHDDQKLAFESGRHLYLTDAGVPKDFTQVAMESEKRAKEVKLRLQNAYRKHFWAGLLESKHCEFLYGGESISEDLETILEREQQRRDEILKRIGRSENELEQAYRIFRWCDRCSLILCQEVVPEMERRLEISSLDGEVSNFISKRDENVFTINPWPFYEDRFSVSTETRILKQLSFDDDAALGAGLDESEVSYEEWGFIRSLS